MLVVQVATLKEDNLGNMVAQVANPMLSEGGEFSVALKAEGTVWTWGKNHKGQLGNDTIIDSDTPVSVLAQGAATLDVLTGIVSVAAGEDHAIAVDKNGVVWAWGSNEHGQLGQGAGFTQDHSNIALQVPGLPTDVVRVAAGKGYSLALTLKGNVWAFGYNDKGQLGIGYTGNVRRYTFTDDDRLINNIAAEWTPRVFEFEDINPYLEDTEGNKELPQTMVFYDYDQYLEELEAYNEEQDKIASGEITPTEAVLTKPVYTCDVPTPMQVLMGDNVSKQVYMNHIVAISAGDGHRVSVHPPCAVWSPLFGGQASIF